MHRDGRVSMAFQMGEREREELRSVRFFLQSGTPTIPKQ